MQISFLIIVILQGFKNVQIMDRIPLHINNNLNTGVIESASTVRKILILIFSIRQIFLYKYF